MLNGTAVEYGLDCCDHHSLRCGLLLGRGSGLLWWLGGKTTHAECLQEGGFSLSRAVARITALIKVLGEDASTGLCCAVLVRCCAVRCAALLLLDRLDRNKTERNKMDLASDST